MTCETVVLSARYPDYKRCAPEAAGAVLGIIVRSETGKTLGFFPQLPVLTHELQQLFATMECLLLDGTFWSNDELTQLQPGVQNAMEMGHIPVAGQEGTLCGLSEITKPRRMYIHINNTNPMLNEAGAEYRKVRESGWEVAYDGCQISI